MQNIELERGGNATGEISKEDTKPKTATLVDSLPLYIREIILSGDPLHKAATDPWAGSVGRGKTRDDLMVIQDAEAAGWIARFERDHWHNPATFERGTTVVWCARGWSRATQEAGERCKDIERFTSLREALCLEDAVT